MYRRASLLGPQEAFGKGLGGGGGLGRVLGGLGGGSWALLGGTWGAFWGHLEGLGGFSLPSASWEASWTALGRF